MASCDTLSGIQDVMIGGIRLHVLSSIVKLQYVCETLTCFRALLAVSGTALYSLCQCINFPMIRDCFGVFSASYCRVKFNRLTKIDS